MYCQISSRQMQLTILNKDLGNIELCIFYRSNLEALLQRDKIRTLIKQKIIENLAPTCPNKTESNGLLSLF